MLRPECLFNRFCRLLTFILNLNIFRTVEPFYKTCAGTISAFCLTIPPVTAGDKQMIFIRASTLVDLT